MLRSLYFALFDSHLRYGCQIWGQKLNKYTTKISKLQNRAVRTISFKKSEDQCEPLYVNLKIIKFFNSVTIFNCLFVAEHINKELPDAFCNSFLYFRALHDHNTRGARNKLINIPQSKSNNYGGHSIISTVIKDWNNIQTKINFSFDESLINQKKLKSELIKYFLNSYL